MNLSTEDIGGQEYPAFLASKLPVVQPNGFEVDDASISAKLFDFQRDIVKWALFKGRCAVFAGTGLGKTAIQLEWARIISERTGQSVLILAPLAVAQQTVREGEKFGIPVNLYRDIFDLAPGINIANYEMMHNIVPSAFGGVVLDESSILKNYDGKTRMMLTEAFANMPYRLCCSATPAPNDHMELGTHSEFLGVMRRSEMLSMYFVHDGKDTAKWRIKGHAKGAFWEWCASWATMITHPSDLGYLDHGFDLPPLNVIDVVVGEAQGGEQMLSSRVDPPEAMGLLERRQARAASIDARVKAAADLVNASAERPWIVWCDLNSESTMLTKAINGAVEITGSDKHEDKERKMLDFTAGRIPVLVTKPSIAGYGMNWQHCCNEAFVGLSDSFEQYYQAVRRCWRFGQQNPVNAYVITSVREGAVVANIKRKEADFAEMQTQMIAQTQELTKRNIRTLTSVRSVYRTDTKQCDDWTLMLGDAVERIKEIADESIDFSVFSPPFSSLYTYSDSERDMGNCSNDAQFFEHMVFLARDLFRVMAPGRNLSFHCMNLPTSKCRDGVIGIKDFRGDLIRMFQAAGFVYHSEVCIWKNPVTAMQRTKALGLLHKQLKKDACMSRQGIPDYLVTMRKPGENRKRVSNTNDTFPVSEWQEYASPVWMDINQSRTLQKKSARAEDDERHICPLQLEVIERAMRLWSTEGDLVLSPFAGIGSEGVVSLQMGRRFVGIELKPSYFDQAALNLAGARQEMGQKPLFS